MNRSVRYFPGTAYLVLGPALAAFTRDAALAERLWPLIAHHAGGQAVLEAALQDGLHELSDFLVVEFDDRRTRVFARGTHTARVTIADGDVVACEGKDVITWAESVFDDAPSGSVDMETGAALPILGGIVRADGFQWESASAVPSPRAAGSEQRQGAGHSSPPSKRPLEPPSGYPGPSRESVATDIAAAARAVGGRQSDADEEPPSDDWSSAGGDARVDATADDDSTPAVTDDDLEIPASPVSPRTPVPAPPVLVPPAPPAPQVPTADPVISAPPVSTVNQQPSPRPVRSLSETRTDTSDEGYDHLFEATVYRNVEDAAVREVIETAVGAAPNETAGPVDSPVRAVPAALGDHDGSTIMASELAALSRDVATAGEVGTPQPAAVLVLVTGEQISLDRGVVIGRRPQIDRVAGTAIPTLVTVPSPQQDISRSHVQIDVDGHGITVTDLHSMNGTVLIKANGVASSIAAGRPYPLQVGDQLDIGDGMTMTVRAAP